MADDREWEIHISFELKIPPETSKHKRESTICFATFHLDATKIEDACLAALDYCEAMSAGNNAVANVDIDQIKEITRKRVLDERGAWVP